MRYISAVSSLHPIDLTEVVLLHRAGLIAPEDSIELSILDDAELPAQETLRLLAPPLALPLPLLVRDDAGVYRQLFAPIDGRWPTSEAIECSCRCWRVRLGEAGTSNELGSLEHRFGVLTEWVKTVPAGASPALTVGALTVRDSGAAGCE
jgi:hypothetical protein